MWNIPHSPISEEISTRFWTAVNFLLHVLLVTGISLQGGALLGCKKGPIVQRNGPTFTHECLLRIPSNTQHTASIFIFKINTVAIRLLHLLSIKAGCQMKPSPPFTPVEMRIGGRPSSGIRFIALPTGLPTWVMFPENTEALSVYKKQKTRKDNIKTVIMIKM